MIITVDVIIIITVIIIIIIIIIMITIIIIIRTGRRGTGNKQKRSSLKVSQIPG